jgi:outer membrane cobalamin receptor
VRGNPDLVPEHSTSLALNATLTGERSSARIGVHATDYRDLIESVGPDEFGTYTYANTAEGTIRGAEWEGITTVGPLRVETGYAWLSARDAATGRPLLGRAEHAARLGLGGPLLGAQWTVSYRWTGRTPIAYDPATEVTTIRADFATLDLNAVATAWRGTEVRGGVRNLLDREPGVGWPGFVGRQMYVALRVTMAP